MLNRIIDVFAAAVVGGMLGLIAHCWITLLIREVIR
nr:MAG TPA: hypothetical protein [Caudoviricetes sp.]